MTQSEFAADTAVAVNGPLADLTISDRWCSLGGHPNGGYLLAHALRAAASASPHPDLLAASAFFLERARPGPAHVQCTPLRIGQRTSVVDGRLTAGGSPVMTLTAAFADLDAAAGPTREFASPPVIPDPESCADPLVGRQIPATIAERIAYRTPTPPPWLHGTTADRPETHVWMRLVDGQDPDPLALVVFADAWVAAVADIGHVASTTIQLSIYIRRRPAPGWILVRLATRHLVNGYHEEDADLWDSSGALVAQSRQLAVVSTSRASDDQR